MSDVAAELGVSPTTVSLALNNHPRISDATKRKVLKVCREMGYQPDPVAIALAHKAAGRDEGRFLGTLAFLEGEARYRVTHANPQRKIWDQQFETLCRNMGYRVDHFVVGETEKEQCALNRILQSRGINGLVIFGYNQDVRQWAFDWEQFAAVEYSGSLHEHFIHNVMSSSYQDVYDAVIRLYDMGYRRPGYFIVGSRFDYWEAGFSRACERLGMRKKVPTLILEDELSSPVFYKHFWQWFNRYEPDVLVANHGDELIRFLREGGVCVPDDVGYLCLDLWDDWGNLSGLSQSRDAADRVIIDLLHSMLMRNEFGSPEKPFCIQIPSVWNEGETLKKF